MFKFLSNAHSKMKIRTFLIFRFFYLSNAHLKIRAINLVYCIPAISGYYAYIEASSPRIAGDTARVLSGPLRSTGDTSYCFSLWYHMFGSDIGSLNVYTRDSDGSNERLVKDLEITYCILRHSTTVLHQWYFTSHT